MAVRKSISITEQQEKFLKHNNISLSKLTQQAINKRIDDLKFAALAAKNLREMKGGKYEEMDFDDFLQQAEK